MKRTFFVLVFLSFWGGMMAHVPVMEPFGQRMESRIREICGMLPREPRGFGPTYRDRVAWEGFAGRYDVAPILDRAREIRDSAMPV